MARPWEETRREFRRIAARVGVRAIAQDALIDRRTVYRLMDGETAQPHALTRERIENIVREHREQSR